MGTRKITTMAGMILAVLSLTVAVQAAPTYSGTLQFDTGIVATPNWNSEYTTFSYDVKLVDGSYWNYEYTFSVVGLRDISHIIIEATGPEAEIGAFSFSDMFGLTTNLTLEDGSPEIKLHTGPGNPGMPDDLYGIKFDLEEVAGEDRTTFTFEFNSRRNPMLGNFYAKSGKLNGVDVIAWNSGFLDDREGISLYDAAAYGLIVVPNATVIIPAPGAILLTGIGTMMVGWLRRRRTF